MTSTDNMETFDLRLKAPFTAIVAGPTGSGKTELIALLIANVEHVCYPPPKEIIYYYGVWQKSFEEIKGVTFCEGMSKKRYLETEIVD